VTGSGAHPPPPPHPGNATEGSAPLLPNDTLRAGTLYLLPGEEHTVVSGGTLTKNGQAFIGWRLGAGANGDLYVPDDDHCAPQDADESGG